MAQTNFKKLFQKFTVTYYPVAVGVFHVTDQLITLHPHFVEMIDKNMPIDIINPFGVNINSYENHKIFSKIAGVSEKLNNVEVVG